MNICRFYNLNFVDSVHVLTPYSTTEALVETALNLLTDIDNPFICDVGTGSGNVIISILANKQGNGIGLDISEEALKIAQINASANRIKNAEFKCSDGFYALGQEKFDLIVMNPPYMTSKQWDSVDSETKKVQPQIAMTDGSGLNLITKVIQNAPQFLKPNSYLLFECGNSQVDSITQLFSNIWKKDTLHINTLKASSIISIHIGE